VSMILATLLTVVTAETRLSSHPQRLSSTHRWYHSPPRPHGHLVLRGHKPPSRSSGQIQASHRVRGISSKLRVQSSPSDDIEYAVIRFKIPGVDEKKLPAYIGAAGLLALTVNHLTSGIDLPEAQIRSEILGAAMGLGCLALPAISSTLESATGRAERPPPLAGTQQMFAISQDLTEAAKLEAAWASASLVLNTNAHRVLLISGSGRVVAARGFFRGSLPDAKEELLNTLSEDISVANRAASAAAKDGGLNLQSLSEIEKAGLSPAAGISSYVVGEAQTVFVSPVDGWGNLWVLTDAPNSLRQKDRSWISNIASKLAQKLPSQMEDVRSDADKAPEERSDAPPPTSSSSTTLKTERERDQGETMDFDAMVRENESRIRGLPLVFGFPGLLLLLANRLLSSTTPTEHVTQADLAAFPLGTALTLTGLIWSDAVRAKDPVPVSLGADSVLLNDAQVGVNPDLDISPDLRDELEWIWKVLRSASRCKSYVVMDAQGRVYARAGYLREANSGEGGLECNSYVPGAICQRAMSSGQGSYIPNLQLNSGRGEFNYLPERTQGLLVKPINVGIAASSQKGDVPVQPVVIILGTDTVRGFTSKDQAWVSTIADKLSITIATKMAEDSKS